MKNKEYNWDLEILLENIGLEKMFLKFQDSNQQLLNSYQTWLDSIDAFVKYHQIAYENEIIANKLIQYISNKNNEDLTDPNILMWMQKLEHEMYEVSSKTSDQMHQIIKNEDLIRTYLKDERVSDYLIAYENSWRYKNHTLSKDQEELLTKVSRHNGGFGDIFSTLTDSDMKYQDAIDKNNKIYKLKNATDIYLALKSNDRILRKSAYMSKYKASFDLRNTLTKTLYYEYLMLNQIAKAKKFDNYIASTAFDDEIDVTLIQHIYNQIKTFKPIIQKYYKYRDLFLKSKFNLKEIKPWDRSLDLFKGNLRFSIEEAQQIVVDALGVMGSDYIKIVRNAFEENWISWLPTPNKNSGAYSIDNTKGIEKIYILINFDKTYNSILTLAHELGHSVHTKIANQNQKIYNDYSIFYAEISSVTNEVLTNYYLLDKYKNDINKQLFILDEMISSFIATTSRQIVFSNFEWEANKWINDGSEFTWDRISKVFLEINHEYFGSKLPSKKLTQQQEAFSLIAISIPHFYAGNFYVYKYAIGQIGAIIVGDKIYNQDQNMKEKLFRFFESGGKLSSLETTKLLGIDLTTNEPWELAKNIFNEWVEQFIQLVKKVLKKIKRRVYAQTRKYFKSTKDI